MKRLLVFVFFVCFCAVATTAWALSATITKVAGDVSVRNDFVAPWKQAKADMRLAVNAEIKTGAGAQCTLTFDDDLKNVITVKENTLIKIASLLPVKLDLSKGRVFALVEDLKKVQSFKIQTPTAIAGVLGTGESVGSQDQGSQVMCFDGGVGVQGLDNQGNPTGSQNIFDGSGIDTDQNGALGNPFEIPGDALGEWDGFRGDVAGARAGVEGGDDTGPGQGGAPEDAGQELQDTHRDNTFEQQRREEEERHEEKGCDEPTYG